MWKALSGLIEITWNSSSRRDCGVAALFALVLVLLILGYLRGDPLFLPYRPIWYTVALVLYFSALVPPMSRMVNKRHEHVLQVAIWGVASLVIFLVWFYACFFAFASTPELQDKWERVLNLPPVIAAVVGAGLGWYVHYQMTAKHHRTANSFNLAMQTRTNSSFIENVQAWRSAYPGSIPADDLPFFLPNMRCELDLRRRELTAVEPQDLKANKELEDRESKLRGVEGVKYLLNFYEFMAFAINVGDLDERLLYETISPAVVGVYDRSGEFRNALNSRQGDKLAFEHLSKLVNGYKTLEDGKEIYLKGWRERLELEKASKVP